jgi:hypothetical protein
LTTRQASCTYRTEKVSEIGKKNMLDHSTGNAVFAVVCISSSAFFSVYITLFAADAYRKVKKDLAEFASLYKTKES